jgi:hypothetical protein
LGSGRKACQPFAKQKDPPADRSLEANQMAEQRGFATSRRPCEAYNFSRLNFEADVLEDEMSVIVHFHVLKGDDGIHV